ncbi:MAG TPA: HdeA/HdeB family chaperone, partial [Xanthobacteraceae bacterium]|nr:HdeA/HdeB family chaperone [Xanthobacteraceae bacterium]
MRRVVIATVAALLFGLLVGGAHAQDSEIDCNAFVKNQDGSWTVVSKVFIPVQNVRVRPGTVFEPGHTFLGDDMTVRLAKACPNQPVATPSDESQTAQPSGQTQTQPGPYVPLSNYADANGNIDIQRLTCAHLAVASPADTGLLVTWYSGWYAGLAKKRGINIARVQYAIRNVADYCKANR